MRWTWFVERDGECWSETFATTAEATAAMAKQQGMTIEEVPARMAEIGIFLASVKVTVTPLMVLRPHGALVGPTMRPISDREIEQIAGRDELTGDAIFDFGNRLLEAAANPTTVGVTPCGSNQCIAGQRDGVLCADGECDRENGVRPDGVKGEVPRG